MQHQRLNMTSPSPNGIDFTNTIHSTTYPLISPLSLDLSPRNILITGASGLIGQHIALSYARAGASSLALLDIAAIPTAQKSSLLNAATTAGHSEPQIIDLSVDIIDLPSVYAAASTIQNKFNGRLDILVNCAGHLEPYQSFLDSDPSTYWKTWEVNLRGTFNITRCFLPMLLDTFTNNNGLNTLVNLTSIAAHNIRPGASGYGTSKLAILRWTETLQEEYREKGLLALAVHPGAVMSKLAEGLPRESWASLKDSPELAGDTMVWLTAGEKGDGREKRVWLGGRYVSVCWDMGMLMERREEIVREGKLRVRLVV
ncbi:MAG: hypothetical protein M1820_006261 [Bogoriella megaspora]|nr:MAG: hypothetical protein M1820_006261 [Bogoriella megaspora]